MATDSGDSLHKQGTDDSWHGEVKEGGRFAPEAGRYHLYIGLFCPFAHRVNLVRHLKGLTDMIDLSIVRPYPKGNPQGFPGWKFPASAGEYPGATVDNLFGKEYLHDVYFLVDREYKGRYSVPLLWDKKENTIVNTESAELLRTMPLSFNSLLSPEYATFDLYPTKHRKQIDHITHWMQRDLNTGVYKSGFAPTQEAYNKNVVPVFAALNKLEKIIFENGGPYILGHALTELDIRAYVTIVRFDPVYVQHFKTNLGTIRHNYPVINNWMKNLYWNVKGFKETTDFKHIKENYTKSHYEINPKGITPLGPFPDIEEGVEKDFSKLKPGGVSLPAVVAQEAKLDDASGKSDLSFGFSLENISLSH